MATQTRLADVNRQRTLTFTQRDALAPFRVVIDADPTIYDDASLTLTITINAVDGLGRQRGVVSTHTGTPGGKSGRWASGYTKLPHDARVSIDVETNKPARYGVILEEYEATPRPRGVGAIAFDEFDYAETGSSATSLAVTGVTCDSGDLLVGLASVFNTAGSTMTVSDPTNGTWSVATGSPVLPDANSQAHIQYFSNSAALSAASVTFNPTGGTSDIDAAVCEISGAAAAAFDQCVENTGALNEAIPTTATVTTGTLAQANNLILSVCTHTGNSTRTFTEDAAYTLIAEDTDNATSQAFHSQRITTATSSTTAKTVTVEISSDPGSGAATWGIIAAVFKEETGVAGGSVKTRLFTLMGVGA